MKKIVKLTEADLVRIVKRVISEQNSFGDIMMKDMQNFANTQSSQLKTNNVATTTNNTNNVATTTNNTKLTAQQTIQALNDGKSVYTYYKLKMNTNDSTGGAGTLTYSHSGKKNNINRNVIINSWDFTDKPKEQLVYVEKIEGNKVKLTNTAGSANITIS